MLLVTGHFLQDLQLHSVQRGNLVLLALQSLFEVHELLRLPVLGAEAENRDCLVDLEGHYSDRPYAELHRLPLFQEQDSARVHVVKQSRGRVVQLLVLEPVL